MQHSFRTLVQPSSIPFTCEYSDRLFFIGSCFAENMGERFQRYFFDALVNPYGVMYNPASVAHSLNRIIEQRMFTLPELDHHRLWHHFDLHGSFSTENPEKLLEHANQMTSLAHLHLLKSRVLVVTWGTSWVYQRADNGKLVANCHRYPHVFFNRRRLEVYEIVAQWEVLLAQLKQIIPELQIIFTISPVRHWKDGAHGNNLSKSILMLAAEALCSKYAFCHYFEAYELLLDDLRDYRFYTSDKLHPSEEAQEYIFDHFVNCLLSERSKMFLTEGKRLKRMMGHRPMQAAQAELQQFLNGMKKAASDLCNSFPSARIRIESEVLQTIAEKQKNSNLI